MTLVPCESLLKLFFKLLMAFKCVTPVLSHHNPSQNIMNLYEKILFDLHEYCKNYTELNMILISWDKNFIKAIKELIEVLPFMNISV